MYYEVYLDYYFLENLFMDYVLLVMTGMAMKRSVSRRRIFLAAFVGSVISCLPVLLPFRSVFLTVVLELLSAVLMVRCGYGHLPGKMFLKEIAVLYLISFLYAGVLQMLAGVKGISMTALQVPAILVMGILLTMYAGLKRETESFQTVMLTVHGKSRELNALYDTGNRLREPYKKRPVSIVEYEAVRELLGKEEKFFLIPCHTVNGESQILTGMVFDEMKVEGSRKSMKFERPVIAFTRERLSSDGSYQMILHPDNSNH